MKIHKVLFNRVGYRAAGIRYRLAAKYTKGNVLDLGCNAGNFGLLLAPEHRYTGIDKDNVFRNQNGHRFIQADLETEERERVKGSFDTITMLAFAEHVYKIKEILSWCCKILNADGLLILTTPTLAGNIVIRLFFDKGHDHVAIYSKQELQKIIREAGFHVEKYQTFEAGMNQLVIARKERIIEGNGSGN